MALQLDLFEPLQDDKDVILFEVMKLKEDIDKMRRSFFVRLDAQEKKYQKLIYDLEQKV